MDMPLPFWKTKSLSEMTDVEWESLCDGCAKCCLEKIQWEGTDEIAYTNVSCRLLDVETCRCSNYVERDRYVSNCVRIDPKNIDDLFWMPRTCAYRLLAEGKDLPEWHPLVTGTAESVHWAGQSVRGRCIPERDAGDLEDHIIDWAD